MRDNREMQVRVNFPKHEPEGLTDFRVTAHTCKSSGDIFYLLSCEVLEREWHFVKFFQF